MKECNELIRNLQIISKRLCEDGMNEYAQIVFDASNKIEQLVNLLEYRMVLINGDQMTVLEALDKLQRERNYAMQYVQECCETCYGEDIDYDAVDCPCWKCNNGSEWVLKEVK